MHWTAVPIAETIALLIVVRLVVPGRMVMADLPLVVLLWLVAVGPSVLTGLLAVTN